MLEYSYYLLTLAKGEFAESPDLRLVGLCSVDRSSLTPRTFPWLPNGCVLRASTSGIIEIILIIREGRILT